MLKYSILPQGEREFAHARGEVDSPTTSIDREAVKQPDPAGAHQGFLAAAPGRMRRVPRGVATPPHMRYAEVMRHNIWHGIVTA